jgi:hypothetical protein
MTAFNESVSTRGVYDTQLLALIGLVHSSSNHCKHKNEDHSKWLETLIDISLQIHENSSISMNTTHDRYSQENLEFLQKIFKNTNLFTYFLSHMTLFAMKFELSSYLADFIHKCQTESVGLLDNDITALSLAVYINGIIDSTVNFSFKLNDDINGLIGKSHEIYLNSNRNDDYLIGLTKTLCNLYDEDSAFYDEKGILKIVLEDLNGSSAKESSEVKLLCEVILTCIAYKSNLVETENILALYKKLEKVCQILVVLKQTFVAFKYAKFLGYCLVISTNIAGAQ